MDDLFLLTHAYVEQAANEGRPEVSGAIWTSAEQQLTDLSPTGADWQGAEASWHQRPAWVSQ